MTAGQSTAGGAYWSRCCGVLKSTCTYMCIYYCSVLPIRCYTCIAFQSVALERIWMLQVCYIIRGGKVTALIRIM